MNIIRNVLKKVYLIELIFKLHRKLFVNYYELTVVVFIMTTLYNLNTL